MDEVEARLRQLLDGTVQAVAEKLATLSDEELGQVEALEKAREKPRAGVLSAIEDEMLRRASESTSAPNNSDADADADRAGGGEGDAAVRGKPARGEAVAPAAWKKPDYTGPLTIEQAEWRRQHIRQK